MQNIDGEVSFTSPSSVPRSLAGRGCEREGINRQPIFIPFSWSADRSRDGSVYWVPDTRAIVPSVYMQVTSRQMVNWGEDAPLFWDLLRPGEFILAV